MRQRATLTIALLAMVLSTTLLASTGTPIAAAQNDYPARDSGYHDYPEMVRALLDAQAAHPDIVRVFSIGKSYQGRTIWAAEVSTCQLRWRCTS